MTSIKTKQIQTLLLSGMGKLPGACLGLFSISEPDKAKAQLSKCVKQFNLFGLRDHTKDSVAQLAFSASGLTMLGIEATESNGFDRAFCEGMTTEFRQRTLGDLHENSPEHWGWSDNETHVAIWIYADRGETAEGQLEATIASRAISGMELLYSLKTDMLPNSREHFGFRDGIANPTLPREGQADPDSAGSGDFVFGYKNSLGVTAEGPTVNQQAFGKFGTYLVLRQLRQNVPNFWKQWMNVAGGDPEKAVWMASKALGRWPNGMPIESNDPCPMPELVPSLVKPMNFLGDSKGMKCPFGSHIRRSNPQDDALDGVLPKHRIFRRGRVYGPACESKIYPSGISMKPNYLGHNADADRGILFACLNTDIARQFEFVQQTWINNPKFRGLHKEVDPIAGGQVKGMKTDVFTVPAKPFRYRARPVESHVQVCGGGYFFLPGKEAVNSIFA